MNGLERKLDAIRVLLDEAYNELELSKTTEKKHVNQYQPGYEVKDARLNLKIKTSTKEKIYELAKDDGISATDLIEELVNKKFEETIVEIDYDIKKSEKKQPISLTVDPFLYEDLKKIAYVKRKKVSEVFDEFIEEYVKKHVKELKEYENINRERCG